MLEQLVLVFGIEVQSHEEENRVPKGLLSMSRNWMIHKDLEPLRLEHRTESTRELTE